MHFTPPLLRGRLIQRYKRFLCDIELENGESVTAHCPNPGSMLSLAAPGFEVWLSPASNPKRKLKYTLELVHAGNALVGVNTARPNGLVESAIESGKIPELSGYGNLRREVRYGEKSRIDILLSDENLADCYVEVKSVTLRRNPEEEPGMAEFPDSVTARGTRHLGELIHMVEAGHRAVMLYLVQRGDCTRFQVANDIDPAYGEAFKAARAQGVEILCYACHITPERIELGETVALAE